jgi:hypothetical protein
MSTGFFKKEAYLDFGGAIAQGTALSWQGFKHVVVYKYVLKT